MKGLFFLVSFIVLVAVGVNTIYRAPNLIYGIEVANDGVDAVLLLRVGKRVPSNPHPSLSKKGVDFPAIAGLYPGAAARRFVGGAQFAGYPNSLPKSVEVEWQLARLTDCQPMRHVDGTLLPGSVSYSSCTWVPIQDAVYSAEIDMDAIRDSQAYRMAGKRNPDLANSRYTLVITLIFRQNQVSVQAGNSSTNPWR